MTLADKIVVMRDGVVEQIGAPLEVFDSPVNRFVAGFIGSPAMNFFDARVVGDERFVRTVDGIDLPLERRTELAAGQSVVYGIRPEHLELSAAGIPALVSVVEPTGSETHVFAKVGDQEVTALVRKRAAVTSGDTIYLQASTEHAYLFDSATGQRL